MSTGLAARPGRPATPHSAGGKAGARGKHPASPTPRASAVDVLKGNKGLAAGPAWWFFLARPIKEFYLPLEWMAPKHCPHLNIDGSGGLGSGFGLGAGAWA